LPWRAPVWTRPPGLVRRAGDLYLFAAQLPTGGAASLSRHDARQADPLRRGAWHRACCDVGSILRRPMLTRADSASLAPASQWAAVSLAAHREDRRGPPQRPRNAFDVAPGAACWTGPVADARSSAPIGEQRRRIES